MESGTGGRPPPKGPEEEEVDDIVGSEKKEGICGDSRDDKADGKREGGGGGGGGGGGVSRVGKCTRVGEVRHRCHNGGHDAHDHEALGVTNDGAGTEDGGAHPSNDAGAAVSSFLVSEGTSLSSAASFGSLFLGFPCVPFEVYGPSSRSSFGAGRRAGQWGGEGGETTIGALCGKDGGHERKAMPSGSGGAEAEGRRKGGVGVVGGVESTTKGGQTTTGERKGGGAVGPYPPHSTTPSSSSSSFGWARGGLLDGPRLPGMVVSASSFSRRSVCFSGWVCGVSPLWGCLSLVVVVVVVVGCRSMWASWS